LILDDPRFEVLWPKSPLLSNYHQLVSLRPKLKDLFDHRTSYSDYEDKSVPLLQDFDPRSPVSSDDSMWAPTVGTASATTYLFSHDQ